MRLAGRWLAVRRGGLLTAAVLAALTGAGLTGAGLSAAGVTGTGLVPAQAAAVTGPPHRPASRPVAGPRIEAILRGPAGGRLVQPFGVAAGQRGAVWVLDRAAGRVLEYSQAGVLLTAFTGAGQGALSQPEGIAAARGGGVWIADTGHHRVLRLSPSGAILAVSVPAGTAARQLSRPVAVAVTRSGGVLVADQGNNRIDSYTAAGGYLRSFAVPGPGGIATDLAGNIFVATAGFPHGNKIRLFSAAGRPLRSFGKTQAGYGALSNPAGLALGPAGQIYVSQPDYGWVTVFRPDGRFAAQLGTARGQGLAFPEGIAVTAAGRVWVADSGGGRVVEFATVRVPVPAPGSPVSRAWWLVLAALAGLGIAAALMIRRRRWGPPGPRPEPPSRPEPSSRPAPAPGPRSSSAPEPPAPPEQPAPPAAPEPPAPPEPVSRRGLIGGATAVAGAAIIAGGVLPASLTKALAAARAAPRRAALADIKHVVILMQENRSFDHYFGTMPGVRGFTDRAAMTLPGGAPVFRQPDPSHPQGYLLPFRYDTKTTSAQATPGLDHSWRTQHDAWARGAMDGWIAAKGQHTMGYFGPDDIPFHWALADAFTICDNYHCSVLGPTDPNRLHMWTGTIDPLGRAGGPVTSDAPTFRGQTLSWTTYPERLQRAGVSWQVYQEVDNYDNNALAWFDQYIRAAPSSPLYQRGMLARPAGSFEDDARHDRLPQVSWLVAPTAQSEHPRYFPAAGAEYIAQKLDAIASNPAVWAKTAFILCYDENDGMFDHVPPPVPPPGTPGEFIGGEPIGMGFRVPVTIVSPWTAGGYVCSDVFDHTSLLRLLETRFGVREPNISAWRRRAVGDLTSAFRLAGGAVSYPRDNTRLRLTAAQASLLAAQREVSRNPAPAIPAVNRNPSAR